MSELSTDMKPQWRNPPRVTPASSLTYTDRQTDRQTDEQTHRQTHRETDT